MSIAVVTRYLGPDDYGKYTLALMYMQLFGVLADVGLFTTVVREISKDPSRTDELVGNTLTLRLLLSIVVIALAAAISLLLPVRAGRAHGDPAGGRAAPVRDAHQHVRRGPPVAAADGPRGDRRRRSGGRVSLGLLVAVVALDLGFYAVLGAAAGGALGNAGGHVVADHGGWRRFARSRTRPCGARCSRRRVPLGLALAINALYFRADTLIISLYEPYDEVGLYTLAYRMLELALVVGTVFLSTTFPIISRGGRARRAARAARDPGLDRGVRGARRCRWWRAASCWRPEIVELAGGEDFAGAADAAADPARGRRAGVGQRRVRLRADRPRPPGQRALAEPARRWPSTSGLNFLLVPRYGIVAAAIVTVASEVLILVGSYPLMRRYFDFFPIPRTLLPALAGGGGDGRAAVARSTTLRCRCWWRSARPSTAGCCGC